MEELEILIDSLRQVEKRRILKKTEVTEQFKEDVFCDLFKREFFKKYYPTLELEVKY